MRFFYFVALILITSCTKNNDLANPEPTPDIKNPTDSSEEITYSLPNSVLQYQVIYQQSKTLTDYTFKSDTQIAEIRIRKYDTLSVLTYIDSTIYSFRLDRNDGLPSYYEKKGHIQLGLNRYHITTEKHELLYDNQRRLIKDSMTSNVTSEGNNAGIDVDLYIYSENYIAVKRVGKSNYGDVVAYRDTIFLNNSNVSAHKIYYTGGGGSELQESSAFQTSIYANPYYNPSVAQTLGALFVKNHIGDFLSPKFMSRWKILKNSSRPPEERFYDEWEKDDKNRITSVFGRDAPESPKRLADYWNFVY